MKLLTIVFVLTTSAVAPILLLSCTPESGEVGPQGEKGDKGDKGDV